MESHRQRCGACKQSKPVEEFSPCYRGKLGTWCKGCAAAYARGDLVRQEHAPRPCSECGEMYVPQRIRFEVGQCSTKCKEDRRTRLRRAAKYAERSENVWCCAHCAKTLPPMGRRDQKYCSPDCSVAARIERKRLIRTARRVGVNCPWCGTPLMGRKASAKNCGSTECRARSARDARIQKKYGMTSVDFDRLVVLQSDLCAICQRPSDEKVWHIDHDHATGLVRGLLCSRCNTGIGQFQDDPARLRAAANYIEGNDHGIEGRQGLRDLA